MAKPLREDAIFLAGRRIAGRMIMGRDTGSRIHEDELFKDFARLDDGQRQGTD